MSGSSVGDEPARYGRFSRIAGAAATIIASYVVIAYLVLPTVWSHYEHQPGLATQPMATVTRRGIPGDPLNVGLVGSRTEILRALIAAGWTAADPITLKSAVEIGLSVVLDRPYRDAPVSSLMYQGRRQDLAFERLVGRSARRRHHVRLWKALSAGIEGREVWLGAATFDRSVGFSHDTGQITHHIDPDIDAERGFFIKSLTEVGALLSAYEVSGVGPTFVGRNGEGDRYFTDGEVIVGVLNSSMEKPVARPKVLPSPPATGLKTRIWSVLVAVGRSLGLLPERRPPLADA